MNSIKGNLCIKVISVLVIIAFLTLDVAWAYPPDSSGQYKLSGQSVFQPKLMNPDDPLATRYKETILYDAKATNTVFNIVKFLWGDPEEGVTPKPLNYMKETLTAELGPNPAGINLSQVRPKGDVPESGIISPDEVLLIPGVRGDAKFIIQVARKDTLSAKELIGYKWLISDISDEYVAKIVTEGYVEEPATPAETESAEAKEPKVEVSEPVAEIDAEIVKTEPEREAPSKRKLIIRAIVGAAVLLLAVMPSAFGASAPVVEATKDLFLGMPIDWNTVFMGFGVYLLGFVNSVITFLGTEKITDDHSIRKKYVEFLLWPGNNFLFKSSMIIKIPAAAIILPLMGILTLPLTLLDILKVILVRIPKKLLSLTAGKGDSYIAPRKEPRTRGAGAVYAEARARILGKDYRGAKPKVEVVKSPKKKDEEIKPYTLEAFLKWARDPNRGKRRAEAKAKRKADKAVAKKAEAAAAKAKPVEGAKPDRVKMKAKAKRKKAKPTGKGQPREDSRPPGPKSPAEEAIAKLKSLQPQEMKIFFDIQRQNMSGSDDWIGFLAGALHEEAERIKGGRQLSPVHGSIVKDLGSIGLRRSADQAVYARVSLTLESHIRRINEYLKQKKERPSPGKPMGTIKTSSHGVSRQMAMEQLLTIYLNAEEGVKLGREHETLISGKATRAVFRSEALKSADSMEVVLKAISGEIISEMGTQRVKPPKKGPEPGSGPPSVKGFLTGGILLALAASLGAGCSAAAKNSSSGEVFAILAVIAVVFYAVFGRSQLVSGGMGSGDAEEAGEQEPGLDEAVLTQIDEAKARVRDTQRELILALQAREKAEEEGEEEETEGEKVAEEDDDDANDLLADVVERREAFDVACQQARELTEDLVAIGLAGEEEIDAAIADARIEIRNAIDGEPIVLTKDEQDELEAEEAAKEAEEAVDHAVIHLELAADRLIDLTKASVKDEEEIQRAREAFERAWKAARELSRNISDELMQEVERAIRNNRARVNSARRRTDRAHEFIARSGNRAAWLMGALYVAGVAGLLLCLAAQAKIPTMIAFGAGIILSGWAALRYLGLREHVRAEMKDFLTYRLAGLDRVGDIMVRTGLIMQEASLPQKEREKVFRFIKEYQDRKDFKKRLIEYLAPVFPVARHDGYRHLVFERLPEDTQRLINIHEAYKSHFWGMVMVLPVVSLFSLRDRQLTQKEVEDLVKARLNRIKVPDRRLDKDVLISEGDISSTAKRIRSISKKKSDIKELLPKLIREVEICYPEPREVVRKEVTSGPTDQWSMEVERKEMVDGAIVVFFDNNSFVLLRNNTQWAKAHLPPSMASDYIQKIYKDIERVEIAVERKAEIYSDLFHSRIDKVIKSYDMRFLVFFLENILDHPCERIRNSAKAVLKIIGNPEAPNPDATEVAECFMRAQERLKQYKDFPRVALVDLTKNLLAIKKSSSSVASAAADMLGVVFLSDKELDVFVDIIKLKIKKTIHKEIGGGDHTEIEFVHTAYDYSKVAELARDAKNLRALFESGMAVPVVARDVQPETPTPAEAHPVEASPLFLKLEGYINNHRDRLVDEANKVITYLNERREIKGLLILNSRSTAEMRDQMEKALADMEKLRESGRELEIPEEVASAVKAVKENLDLFEAEGIIAAIILLARKAERNGKNLVIGLETDWIPGLEKGNLQHNAVSPLLNMIESLQDELRSLGLKNVTIVHKKGDELADAVLAEATDESETIQNADFSNVVILASRETINSRVFSVFKNVEKNAFLAEVDARELRKAYEENGEAFDKQITARITEMFCLALELAAGKTEPMFDIPWLGIDYNEALRIVTFLPKAEPEDYDKLQEKYKNKILALKAA